MIFSYLKEADETASLVISLQLLTTRNSTDHLVEQFLDYIRFDVSGTASWFRRRSFGVRSYFLAVTMQAIGYSSSFTSGAPWIGMRGSRSPCKPRAGNFSAQGSLAVPGEDEGSSVDYDDVATQWLSADFLDLRLRSSGLVCNEAIQALRSHFQKKDEHPTESDVNSMPSTAVHHSLENGAPSAYQGNRTRALPNVVVLDENFSQWYNSSDKYTTTTTCSFLDESFC